MIKGSDQFEVDLKCLDWTPDGKYIICGGESGMVFSVDAEELSMISSIRSKLSEKVARS